MKNWNDKFWHQKSTAIIIDSISCRAVVMTSPSNQYNHVPRICVLVVAFIHIISSAPLTSPSLPETFLSHQVTASTEVGNSTTAQNWTNIDADEGNPTISRDWNNVTTYIANSTTARDWGNVTAYIANSTTVQYQRNVTARLANSTKAQDWRSVTDDVANSTTGQDESHLSDALSNSTTAQDLTNITVYVYRHASVICNNSEPCGDDVANACPTIEAAYRQTQKHLNDHSLRADITIVLIGRPVDECVIPTEGLPIYFSKQVGKLTIKSNDQAGCPKATILTPNKRSAFNTLAVDIVDIIDVHFRTYYDVAYDDSRECAVLTFNMFASSSITVSGCEFNILPGCAAIFIPYRMTSYGVKVLQLLSNVIRHIPHLSNDSARTDYHIQVKRSMVEIDSNYFTSITILNCSFDSYQVTGIWDVVSDFALKIQLHQSSNPHCLADICHNRITIQRSSFVDILGDGVLDVKQYLPPGTQYLVDVLLDSVMFISNRYSKYLLKTNNTNSFQCLGCYFENNTSIELGSTTILLESNFDAHFLFENFTLNNSWLYADADNQLQSVFKLRTGQITLQGVSTAL